MAKPVFVARRNDGFGARLAAMLNAMVLSKHCNGEFQFVWPEFPEEFNFGHAVSNAESTFSKDFIRKFGIERVSDIRNDGVVAAHLKRGGILESAFDHYSCLVVPHTSFYYSLPEFHGQIPSSSFREMFDRIEFSPALEKARFYADQVLIEDEAVAVHLRAGDVIYGAFRHTHGYLQKAIPYPLAEMLIKRHLKSGNTVILFGQDDELVDYISEKYPVICANIIKSQRGFDDGQSALFDIALMARCEKVFGGASAFSEVASLVSGYQRTELRSMFSPQDIISSLNDLITNVGAIDSRISGH